jgi:hypothetical protein
MHPAEVDRACIFPFDDSHKESEMKIIADKGKIKIGGGAISLIKPAVADKGKIKIGGGAINLIKPVKK